MNGNLAVWVYQKRIEQRRAFREECDLIVADAEVALKNRITRGAAIGLRLLTQYFLQHYEPGAK